MNEILSINESKIYFGKSGVAQLLAYLEEAHYSSLVIIVDKNTEKHCLPLFASKLQPISTYKTFVIPAGESHKTLESCQQLWKELSNINADRKTIIINLGGGVVTDLGGFVASTFLRGLRFINVPTSLLSMVDASVGGKTGIDFQGIKNQIGVINHPEMVIVDTDYLSTLPKVQFNSGIAEMLKHGLIADAAHWHRLSENEICTSAALKNLIGDSIKIKNSIVLQDPYEKALRKILNFGHTLGHAIESYFLVSNVKKTLLHGEAIAIGLILESFISAKLFNFQEKTLVTLTEVIFRYFKKVSFTPEDIKHIINLLKHDKKNSDGHINFVLLRAVGQPELDCEVPEELIYEAFAFYAKLQS
ncbi:MAG TPA: 3-dehydroquinate synthase [Flavobacteriaceae bacterium]|nr:3-dehydroquinate synthase [Flavobacteriaceae bacterium]